jgi:hypothetical protein
LRRLANPAPCRETNNVREHDCQVWKQVSDGHCSGLPVRILERLSEVGSFWTGTIDTENGWVTSSESGLGKVVGVMLFGPQSLVPSFFNLSKGLCFGILHYPVPYSSREHGCYNGAGTESNCHNPVLPIPTDINED